MRTLLAFATMTATGCLTAAELPLDPSDLSTGDLAVDIEHDAFEPNLYSLVGSKLGANPPTNAAKESDCIALRSSISVTANGIAARSASFGSFDNGDAGLETNCIPPSFQFDLGGTPASVGFVLDDGTATLHVDMTLRPDGSYAVTRCDAGGCSFN